MRGTAPESTPRTWTDLPRRIAETWDRFWFSPGDPLPLGVIRICAGLVLLYVHLVYSGDLQALLGPNAWLDLQTINGFRENTPWLAPPLEPIESAYNYPQRQLPPITRAEADTLFQEARTHGMTNIMSADDLRKLKEQGVYIPNERRLMYFMEWGCDPDLPPVIARGNWIFSLWFHVTDPAAMVALHVTFLVILFCFTIGFCTRITSVLTWIGVLSYIQRTANTVFGMDTMMNIVTIYLMIAPCGATLSMDRLIAHWWAKRRSPRGPQRPLDLLQAPPQVSANLALRLMQVHLCFIYLTSGLSKMLGNAWWNGTSTWMTMANPEFSPLRFQFYMDMVQFLAAHPWMWYIVMNLGAAFTLFFEISFAYLVWHRRTRWMMLAMAVMLHAGIAIFMGLVTFSLIMMPLLMAFVPAESWHRFLEKVRDRLAQVRARPEAVPDDGRSRLSARPQAAHVNGG